MVSRYSYNDSSSYIRARIRRRRGIIAAAVTAVCLAVLGVLIFIYNYYKVVNVSIEGSTRYTDSEIREYVMGGFLGDNSAVLSLKSKNKKIPEIPFVESIGIEVISHDTVRIRVYERSVAGCVDYLGTYLYFTRNGTVVESSRVKLDGIPEVTGLEFDHVILYEPLPVEDPHVFARILNVTQLLQKYELKADKLYFDHQGNMFVYFGEIRINMGPEDYSDEKIAHLRRILPSLAGKSGTLEMTNFTPDTHYITFTERN